MIYFVQEEKRKRIAAKTEFSAEDLSLATIPGLEFDPKERAFDMDELRPQPIIKKRSKLFVRDQEKVSHEMSDNECFRQMIIFRITSIGRRDKRTIMLLGGHVRLGG